MRSPYTREEAERRVRELFAADDEAQEHCLYDWPERQAHVDWLCTAGAEEIRDWVEATRQQ
jgi:hypothetical protein